MTRTLHMVHNNGYDTIVLCRADGIVISTWPVTPQTIRDYRDPGNLADWEDHGLGDEGKTIADYGAEIPTKWTVADAHYHDEGVEAATAAEAAERYRSEGSWDHATTRTIEVSVWPTDDPAGPRSDLREDFVLDLDDDDDATTRETDLCPYCLAHGGSDSDSPRTDATTGRRVALNDGCTEPLSGYLCADCDAAVGEDLTTTPPSYDEWMEAWRSGNDRGDGYAVGEYDNDTPHNAASFEGWDVIDQGPQGEVLAIDNAGRHVVICDSNGPWAVRIDNDDN